MRASSSLFRTPGASTRPARRAVVSAVGQSGLKSPTRSSGGSKQAPFLRTAATTATTSTSSSSSSPVLTLCRRRLGSTSTSTVAAAAASSSSPAPTSASRHAPLHDFCALIPYGFLLGAASLVSLLFFGARDAAGVCAAASAASLVSARLSLARWRAGASCAPVTSAAAAVATSVAFWFYRAASATTAGATAAASLWCLRLGGVLSAAVALVLWGNLLLGGNAPRRKTA